MLLGGLGLLQTIPLFATLGVERGWWASLKEIFLIFVTGGPLHFMFHIQTKATYMAQTIIVGGAKYRPTGRGFVTQHTPFDEQFRFFASSHLYLGVELGAGLLLMGIYTDAGQYVGRSWSLWLASASFLCAPFWFNPLTFDWNVVTSDYDIWLKWIRGSSGGAAKSWSMWWNEENAFYKSMPLASKLMYVVKAILFLLVGDGIRRSNLFKSDTTLSKPTIGVTNILIFISVLLVLGRIFAAKQHSMPYPVRRTTGIMLFTGYIISVLILFLEDSNYIRYALAGYYGMGAICLLGLLSGFKFVKLVYLIHDVVCAHIIFIPLIILAALQLPGMIQTWLLYHNALSTDVVVSDILRYARKTQESGGEANEDLTEQIAELKKIVQKQEQILTNAGLLNEGAPSGAGMSTAPSSGSVAELLAAPVASVEPAVRPPAEAGRPYGRALSMSGMDVWGNMALGDTQTDESRQGITFSTETPNANASAPPLQGFSFTQPDTMPPR